MQVGDLVTGGDVVGVVKENGPFGMKGSSATIPARLASDHMLHLLIS